MAAGKHILGKQNAQRVFGTAKVGDRGQIVIPKEAREFFGIEPGDTLLILGKAVKPVNLGTRKSFADIAATIAHWFHVTLDTAGQSLKFES